MDSFSTGGTEPTEMTTVFTTQSVETVNSSTPFTTLGSTWISTTNDAVNISLSFFNASARTEASTSTLTGDWSSSKVFDEASTEFTGNYSNLTTTLYNPGGDASPPAWLADFNDYVAIVVPVFYGIICSTGFIGNLLVILVLLRFSTMKTLPNIYIFNLAVADFLFMFTIPFIAYQFVTKKWIFGHVFCKFVMSFDGMNQFTGVFLLTAMSIDRYVALVHPIKSLRRRTPRNSRIICITMWVASGLVCLPLWIYSETFPSLEGNVTECGLKWGRDVYHAFILYAFILGYVIPLLIICVCYFSIFRLIMTNKQPGIPSLAAYSSHYVSICLSYGNSAINPLIYTFVGRNFKKSFVNIICLMRILVLTPGR
ncbi:somatostatin receptor type 2-like [Glandiceps talaboti]